MTIQDPEPKPIRHRRKTTSPRNKPPAHGGKSVKNSWTSPKRILAREREAEMLEFRKSGLTHAEIGQRFGVSAKTAYKWIVRGMEHLVPVETASQVRAVELGRLDTLINRIWPQCTADNLAAINTFTRLADLRAKLCGLYPRDPTQAVQVASVLLPTNETRLKVSTFGWWCRGKTAKKIPTSIRRP